MTPASLQALANLRRADHMDWTVVPMLAFVVYIYIVEVERRRYDIVLGGLMLYAAEWVWEIFNALILHWTGHAALWTAPARSSYLFLVGLNVEITLMFAVMGVAFLKLLPRDRTTRWWGLPNRPLAALGMGLFCVATESTLNAAGLLIWEYDFWRWPNIGLIVVAYSLPLYALGEIHDRYTLRAKAWMLAVATASAVASWLVFVVWLRWV